MSQQQPFSATNPPDKDDIEACIEWSREIVRRNREFVEQERRLYDATREDPYL